MIKILLLIVGCLGVAEGYHGVINRKRINDNAHYVNSVRLLGTGIIALLALLILIIKG